MQSVPANWGSIFSASHKTEYRFTINGVNYEGDDLKDTPIISKPLLDKPAIGRCCTGSAKVKIYPKGPIPKAATVDVYCRLRKNADNTVTSWLPQGKFYVSSRKGKDLLEITCLDRMIKAGVTYRDKSAFNSWPQPMSAVVNEICSIMGVTLDARTQIKTGTGYTVDYPNDDVLISEILGMIGAAHGGSWIFTESGKLRLVVLASPAGDAVQILGKTHMGFTPRGKTQTISRVILVDDAENEFTAGDDSGLTISAKCNYATQAIAYTLCSAGGIPVENGCLTIPDATFSKGLLSVGEATVANGKIDLQTASVLYGVTYEPYTLSGAYLNPAVELGDTLSVTDRDGTIHRVVVFSIEMSCTVSCTCALSALIDDETEDEYPYISARDLSLKRTVRTNQTYYGNRINRSEGFVSELLINDVLTARMTANAATFSMQSKEGNSWVDRIYFDSITGKYVITGDVTVQGLATFISGLATSGSTVINGGNITTGQIKSNSGNGFTIDLTNGTISVGNKDLNTALNAIDNEIAISASAQMFTKASGASSYSPSSITLTAQSTNTLASYQWYKDNTALSGKTARTLTISPSDISGTSATYKVVGTDSSGKTYTDMMTVAKLADGSPGTPGSPGTAGQDSYTAILSNEYVEIPVNVQRKPLAAGTYSCVVSVYKGLTAMTATNSTPASGQFKVTPGTAPTGVTVKQNTAGTITLTVATNTAILDSSELPLTITVYGGITVNAKITVHANMNDVTVMQQSSIEQNATNITLKVSKDSIISEINQSAEQITISASKVNLSGYVTFTNLSTSGQTTIDGGNIKTGTITATQIAASTITGAKIASQTIEAGNIKSGTITATQIASGTITATQIASGTITATQLAASTITGAKIAANTIEASNIKASTITGAKIASQTIEASNIKTGTITATQIASGTITATQIASGTITATQLAASTITGAKIASNTIEAGNIKASTITGAKIASNTIEAGNIKAGAITADKIATGAITANMITTGTMSADRISGGTIDATNVTIKNLDVSNAHIQTMYAKSSNYYIVMKSVGVDTLYIGGDGTWNMQYVYMYCNTSLELGKWGASDWQYRVLFDTASRVFRPRGTNTYAWDVGSSTYPFKNGYFTSLYVGGTQLTLPLNTLGYSSSIYASMNSSGQFNPKTSTTTQYTIAYSLGSSSYAWGDIYVFQAHLGTSTSSKIGFFGTTPNTRQTLSLTSNNMGYTSVTASNYLYALNNLIGILKSKYGLIA